MPTITNSPAEQTVLRLEARKAFSLMLRFYDDNGNELDISMSSFTFNVSDARTNASVLVVAGSLEDPSRGKVVFNLQPSMLDLPAKEYLLTMVQTVGNYPAVVIKGVVEVLQNSDLTVGPDFVFTDPMTTLGVHIEQGIVHIRGPVIPPGPQGEPGPRGLPGPSGSGGGGSFTIYASFDDLPEDAEEGDMALVVID